MTVRHAVFLPPFDEFADPRLVAETAVAAERNGWDGLFLWDHVLRPDPPRPVGDPWVALGAAAMVTDRIRLGPMVTPLVRRRPATLARECVSLDVLSRGRLTFGAGLGVDTGRELSAFGEVLDASDRGRVLDEGLDLLCALWTGEQVHHRGDAFLADGVTFLPVPVQRPRIPIWLAARTTNRAPLRRAARYEGVFVIEQTPDSLSGLLDVIVEHRGSLDGFEVAVPVRSAAELEPWESVGATWAMWVVEPGESPERVRALVSARPPTP